MLVLWKLSASSFKLQVSSSSSYYLLDWVKFNIYINGHGLNLQYQRSCMVGRLLYVEVHHARLIILLFPCVASINRSHSPAISYIKTILVPRRGNSSKSKHIFTVERWEKWRAASLVDFGDLLNCCCIFLRAVWSIICGLLYKVYGSISFMKDPTALSTALCMCGQFLGKMHDP